MVCSAFFALKPESLLTTLISPVATIMSPGTQASTRSSVSSHSIVRGMRLHRPAGEQGPASPDPGGAVPRVAHVLVDDFLHADRLVVDRLRRV